MVNDNWGNIKWGDLSTLEYGKGLRSSDYTHGQYPIYGTNGQIGCCDKYLYPKPGIIIGRKGAYRGVHYSKKPFYVIDTAFYLKPINHTFDIKWAYYHLLNFDINNIDSGSAIPSTSREAFYQIPVRLPPILDQWKIAAILSAYDDLIENNSKRIKIIEEMAQNLYREWFVNFRFPGHENVKLVESPLGMIPQGWEVTTLDKIITIKSGFPFKRDIYDEDGPFGVVTIKNVQDGFFEKACTNRINKIPPKFPDYCYLKDGDVLISLTGNIGRVCLVCGNNLLLNQRVGKFIPQNIKNITFLYMMFRQKEMQEQLGTISNGVAQQNLSPVETGKLKILSPSSELIDNYLELSNPIFKQILLLIKKNDNLRQTRDLLLPKLISGEIDVSDLDIKVREPA